MNQKILLLFLFITAAEINSLEIWLNDSLFRNISDKTLLEISYIRPSDNLKGVYLSEIIPIMENIESFKFLSSEYLMETDYSDSIFITLEDKNNRLIGDSFGIIKLPELIELQGTTSNTESLTIWFDKEDPNLIREINLFSELHNIEIEIRVENNLKSLLEYNHFNNNKVADLIIYNQEKLNSLSPLLRPLNEEDSWNDNELKVVTINDRILAVPLKMSIQLILNSNSYNNKSSFTMDCKNLNNLYPLFIRFGMDKTFNIESDSIKDCLFYLRGLYRQDLYKMAIDPREDFISGVIDSIYTSSTIFSQMVNEPLSDSYNYLPQSGEENLLPLLQYKLISLPLSSANYKNALKLTDYLTGPGVQQRINPKNGYLPVDESVYFLLNDSNAKTLLLRNLENAVSIDENEEIDKLRFALSKITSLIITDRLTIEDGIREIKDYINQ